MNERKQIQSRTECIADCDYQNTIEKRQEHVIDAIDDEKSTIKE